MEPRTQAPELLRSSRAPTSPDSNMSRSGPSVPLASCHEPCGVDCYSGIRNGLSPSSSPGRRGLIPSRDREEAAVTNVAVEAEDTLVAL